MPAYGSVVRHAAAGLTLLATVSGCRSTSTNVTAPSTAEKCTATLTTSTREFGAEGGTGRVTVETERECQWALQSDVAWLTVKSGAGQGSGTAEFAVAPTPDPVARTAALTVADAAITISQRAAGCQFRFSAGELSVPASGGGRDIDVTASSGLCEWTAQAEVDWVSFRSAQAFRGSGRVTLETPPWAGPLRRTEIVVADHRVPVTQSSGCAFNVTPTSSSIPAGGGTATASVQTAQGCGWSTANQIAWITIAGTLTASSGPGTVILNVAPNIGAARTGTPVIAGRQFTVNQDSGCQYAISLPSYTWSAAGGNGQVYVTTGPDCRWSSSIQADWVTFVTSPEGVGSGWVAFFLAPNTGGPRATTLTIASRTFTAFQESAL